MLRKSPIRTEAFLAANRRNALKSTGPRTARGKARSCMNALKHGRYAKRLPEKLTVAGDQGGAALYQKIRGEVGTAFRAATHLSVARQLDEFAAEVWVKARAMGVNGRKPRVGVFSKKSRPATTSRVLNCLVDERRRIGIVYWVQRRRYWTLARKLELLAGRCPPDVPTLGEALEDRLRHRVYQMKWPGLWERQRLGIGEYCNRMGSDGPTGSKEQTTGNSNRVWPNGVRLEAPGARPGHEDAAPGQTSGAGSSVPTPGETLQSILLLLMAELLGGGR